MIPRSILPPAFLAALLAVSLGAGSCVASAQPAPAGPARTWALPAGPLGTTLLQIAQHSGQSISVPPELVRGLNAPAVQGALTAEEAAATALVNSTLELVRTANGTLSVRARTTGPASAAGEAGPTLSTVTVSAEAERSAMTERTGAYTPRATAAATRLPLSLRETPQSVTVVTSQQIEDRGITGLAQALETVPGIHVDSDWTRPGTYSRGLMLSNIHVDGNPIFPGGQALSGIQSDHTVFLDRIEVLRGANGLLTGPGDPSGSITLVRKRATREFQASVQGSLGSWRNWAGEVDVAGPLNASGTVRGRVAAGTYGGDYFIDDKGKEGKALLATVEVDLTPRTVARLGYQHDELTYEGYTGGSSVPLWYSNGVPYNAPRSMSNTPRELTYEHRVRSLYAGLEHDFGNGWAFQGTVDLSRREKHYPNPMIQLNAPNYPAPSGIGAAMGSYIPYPTEDRQWAYNFDAQGPLSLFGREHQLIFGASGWDRRLQVNEWELDLSGQPPASFAENFPVAATPWGISYPYRLTGFPRSRGFTEQHGAFAAARWNLADSLKLITGVRITHWKTWTDRYNGFTGQLTGAKASAYAVRREITPYVGAVWDFHPNLSAYASYADIFKPQNLYDAGDSLLEPVVGKNHEAGLKGEFLDGRLNASAAIFRVVQDNLGERDPNYPDLYLTPGGNTPYRSAGKGVTTRGFEAEVSGTPVPGWNISAGYTYAKSKNAKGEPFDRNLPEHLLRVFTTYRLPGDWSKLTVGGGANWNSSISQNQQRPTGAYQANGQPVTADYEFREGGVWRLNAMARYAFTPRLSLQLNVDNLLDKKYYGFISPWGPLAYYGQPRRWRATLRYQY